MMFQSIFVRLWLSSHICCIVTEMSMVNLKRTFPSPVLLKYLLKSESKKKRSDTCLIILNPRLALYENKARFFN